MTPAEVAAWEKLARTGQLGRYLGKEGYQKALQREVERLRMLGGVD